MWKALQWLTLITVFTSPWCYGLITVASSRLSAVDVLGVACIGMFLVIGPGRHIPPVYYFLLAYVLAALISLVPLVADEVFLTLLVKWGRLCAIIGAGCLAGILPRRWRHLDLFVRAFYWGGLISVVYGIAAFYFQWSFGTAVQSYYYDSLTYLRRAGGVFQDSSAFGHMLATWTAVQLLFGRRESIRSVVWLTLTFVIAGIGLYACLSRAAVVHIGVVLILMGALPRRETADRRPRRIWLALALLVLIVIAINPGVRDKVVANVVFTTERILQPFASAFKGIEALDDSGGRRISTWNRTIDIWMTHPALGIGYKGLVDQYAIYCDNTMLLALVETGLLGAVCLTTALAVFFRASLRAYAHGAGQSREVLIFLAGQAVHSILVDTMTFTGTMPFVFVLAMIAYVNSRSMLSPNLALSANVDDRIFYTSYTPGTAFRL